MTSYLLAFGRASASPGVVDAILGSRTFVVADTTALQLRLPIFLHRTTTGQAAYLGNLVAKHPGNALTTAHELALPPLLGEPWELVQPAHWVRIPPHAMPLLHREYRLGSDDLATEGREHLWASTRLPEELWRIRAQSPDARLLGSLFAWFRLLGSATVPEFTLVLPSRTVVHAALAQPGIEVRPADCRAGEPFDMMVRPVAENRLHL